MLPMLKEFLLKPRESVRRKILIMITWLACSEERPADVVIGKWFNHDAVLLYISIIIAATIIIILFMDFLIARIGNWIRSHRIWKNLWPMGQVSRGGD